MPTGAMAQFDPRRQPLRFAPRLITAAAAIVVSTLVWKVVQPAATRPAATPDLDPTAIAALETRAFAAASARPGLADPQNVRVTLKPGETVAQAVVRLGVAAEDAQAAGRTLAQANVRAITAFQAAIAKPLNGSGAARLIGLTLRTSPATSLTLSRSYDGVMKLHELQERVSDETTVAHGRVAGSLFQSAAALGATSQVTNQVVKLFQHRLDFARDITSGDHFTMVFDRRVTESGRTVEIGHLLFASLQAHGRWVNLYRFEHNGKVEYFDENGKNIKGLLLRTPVDGAHMTSTFGMRMHPILGFMRMHQGVDFGAPVGSPVLAAGDGVVVETRRWGGYGNWLRIRHSGGWDTGYAHLSRYARGIHPGVVVHQGEVVAYVGTTGNSTGPHLHFETWFKGKRVNPMGAQVPQGTILSGRELAAFKTVKAQIDAMVANRVTQQAKTEKVSVDDGLRPTLSAGPRS